MEIKVEVTQEDINNAGNYNCPMKLAFARAIGTKLDNVGVGLTAFNVFNEEDGRVSYTLFPSTDQMKNETAKFATDYDNRINDDRSKLKPFSFILKES